MCSTHLRINFLVQQPPLKSLSLMCLSWRGEQCGWDQVKSWVIILELPAKTCALLPVVTLWPDSSPLPLHLCSFVFYFRSIASYWLEGGANSYFLWVWSSHQCCQAQIFTRIYCCTCRCCSLRVISVFISPLFYWCYQAVRQWSCDRLN